mmetsp:Transcript_44151/g.104499  ORF Transcript_44151/g.104499 Transcript_44151/m.104499 type:complete len:330 (-) Transcript_44151:4545-5534(-)
MCEQISMSNPEWGNSCPAQQRVPDTLAYLAEPPACGHSAAQHSCSAPLHATPRWTAARREHISSGRSGPSAALASDQPTRAQRPEIACCRRSPHCGPTEVVVTGCYSPLAGANQTALISAAPSHFSSCHLRQVSSHCNRPTPHPWQRRRCHQKLCTGELDQKPGRSTPAELTGSFANTSAMQRPNPPAQGGHLQIDRSALEISEQLRLAICTQGRTTAAAPPDTRHQLEARPHLHLQGHLPQAVAGTQSPPSLAPRDKGAASFAVGLEIPLQPCRTAAQADGCTLSLEVNQLECLPTALRTDPPREQHRPLLQAQPATPKAPRATPSCP